MGREIRVNSAALREFTKDLTSILNDVLLPGLERQKYLFTDPVTFGEDNPSGELYQRRMETSAAIRDGHENLSKQIASLQFLIEAVGKIADGYDSSDALSEGALQKVLQRSTGVTPAPSAGPAPSPTGTPLSDVTPAPSAGDPPSPSAGEPPSTVETSTVDASAVETSTVEQTTEPSTVEEFADQTPVSAPLDNDQMSPAMTEEA
jgi:hypothetical protein